jgi:hypothetical protein
LQGPDEPAIVLGWQTSDNDIPLREREFGFVVAAAVEQSADGCPSRHFFRNEMNAQFDA